MIRFHFRLRRPTATIGALLGLLLLSTAAGPARAQGDPPPGFRTLILSPEPGEMVPQGMSMVGISFIDPGRRLDVTSVQLYVNGVDQTAEASINADVLIWVPQTVLRRGIHNVAVTLKDRGGAALPTVSWSFMVGQPAEGAPVPTERVRPGETREGLPAWARLSGDITVEGGMYSIGGDGADVRRQAPATGKAWMNAGGRLGANWRYGFYTHLNSYESHTRQPINRFRFDLRGPWLSVGAGDVTPRLQELILWGRRVRGFSLDLRGGLMNLAVVSGESRREIQGQLYGDDPTRVYRTGVYAQDLLAIRPYFGSGDPWQFGITLFKARDAVDSIPLLRTQPAFDEGPTRSANATPKDNLVLGLDFTWKPFGGKLTLAYENALSLYANDISGGPLKKSELDSIFQANDVEGINFDPASWESIFILNASMIPLDPTGLTNIAQQVRGSLQLGGHTLGMRWRSIGGSYYTLGQTSLQRDQVGLRVQDTFRLLRNRLGVTVGWEAYSDNLNDSKPTTTENSALTLDLAWQTDNESPGFTVGYRDFGRANSLTDPGAGGINERNATYSFGTFVPVGLLSGFRTRVNLNYVSTGRSDAVNPRAESRNDFYLVGVTGRMIDQPTEFGITYGLSGTELTGYGAKTAFHRVQLRGRHAFGARWATNTDLTLTQASPGTDSPFALDYSRTELFGGAEYYWTRTFYSTLRAGYATYTDRRDTGLDSTELTVVLRVTRGF